MTMQTLGAADPPVLSIFAPIEHITKLITINEAVVDTSEIDSVKPSCDSSRRRSSATRRSEMSRETPSTVTGRPS